MSTTAHAMIPAGPRRSGWRALLGIRQTLTVGQVRYRELTTDSPRRALSRRGPGYKDYIALFPGGASLRIRFTPRRWFADLAGERFLPIYQLAEPFIRPGMRILIVRSGTGYIARWVASRAGPSGAVVALDPDRQSIAYAQLRYPSPNVAFETGGLEALAGETDAAFDGVLAVGALAEGESAGAFLGELGRVIAPGGWLLCAFPLTPWPRDKSAPGPAVLPAAQVAEILAPLFAPADGPEKRPDPARPGPILSGGVLYCEQRTDGWTVAAAAKPQP